jgi:hypothetical protein
MEDTLSKELQDKLAAAEKMNEKLKKSNAALKVVAIENKVAVEIDGTFKAMVLDESKGKNVEKTFKFVDGFPTCRVDDGLSTIVYSEMLMKIANGEELSESDIARCPQAQKVTKAVALKTLQSFVDMEVSFVELA